ncbi:unnamed protein product [Blepharisma stoltei]|uniref:Superoxide dismutase n=1 Tax=Blepharisma stoltei TaxID=1481888 RepID=A0AAU9JD44_9CILI|nr:unnamed protein product [Blepharisma stoltei]
MKALLVALFLTLTLASTDCEDKIEFSPSSDTYEFTLANLPYPQDFLEPILTSQILYAHHDHHHQTYYDKLNSYIAEEADLQDDTLLELVKGATNDESLQKYAGGAYNHNFYWWVLTNPTCAQGQPSGSLYEAIVNTWGSFSDFQTAFDDSSTSLFGSGWTWLCVNESFGLEIRNTANQINPMMQVDGSMCYPILANDIWEHAYYLKYMWDRASYIDAFWKIIDWDIVENFYENYASQLKGVPL